MFYIILSFARKIRIYYISNLAAMYQYTDKLIMQFAESNITSIEDIDFGLALPQTVKSFIPTILKLAFVSILPLLVSWSDRFLGHWTRSDENHSIMKKTFWYFHLIL